MLFKRRFISFLLCPKEAGVTAIAIGITALVSLLLIAIPAWAGGLPESRVEYSADSVMETEEATLRSKVYQSFRKKRIEQTVGGGRQVIILRQDKGVMWLLMPQERIYIEQSVNESDDLEALEIETTIVGPDVIDGQPTTKYKTIARRPDGIKLGGFTWVTDHGIPVKIDLIAIEGGTKTRMKMELKNVAVVAQDPGLFEIPAGYQKMAMGGIPIPGRVGPQPKERAGPESTPAPERERDGADVLKDVRKRIFGR